MSNGIDELLDFQSAVVLAEARSTRAGEQVRAEEGGRAGVVCLAVIYLRADIACLLRLHFRSLQMEQSVDVWLRQFAWVRALCEAARRLHAAGHFSFLPHYHYEYTLLVSLVL